MQITTHGQPRGAIGVQAAALLNDDLLPPGANSSHELLPGGLTERDPDYIGRTLPLIWPLIAAWFRPDIRGLHRYPGGDWEVHRPSWQGHQVEFAGREGFIRLALAEHVPIVPVVSIGGQETALFLTRGERIA